MCWRNWDWMRTAEPPRWDFDAYLRDRYTVTRVAVGPASHDTNAYWSGKDSGIQAKVTFYGFDDTLLDSKTVDIASAAQTVRPQSPEKVKYAVVSYECPAFLQATGYALGQHFAPGEVKVTIALERQTGGEGVQAITKVTNTARTTMTYRSWDTRGAQQGLHDRMTDTLTSTADNAFGELKTARNQRGMRRGQKRPFA